MLFAYIFHIRLIQEDKSLGQDPKDFLLSFLNQSISTCYTPYIYSLFIIYDIKASNEIEIQANKVQLKDTFVVTRT